MDTKLSVKGLRISFRTVSGKVQAVRDISFDLREGETLAIVGESGSGKSVTAKAMLGILAGNAMVEGGSILYDGQDLLRITEEDFYKIRGDKIAMIYQDPLSSLNPIMRIGKQLTEAMILKGKARQRACRANFRDKLALLEKNMREANPVEADKAREKTDQFRKYMLSHVEVERAYNEAYEAAREALEEIDHILFLIKNVGKNALNDKKEVRADINDIKELCLRSVNPYVVSPEREPELVAASNTLSRNLPALLNDGQTEVSEAALQAMRGILNDAVSMPKPDFSDTMPAGPMNDKTDMDEFVRMAEGGVRHAEAKYLALREKAVQEMDRLLKDIKDADALPINEFKTRATSLSDLVNESINPMDIVKDSAACTFAQSLKGFVRSYIEGERTNDRKTRSYERRLRRLESRAAKGKAADWKLAKPSVIDLSLVKRSIIDLIASLQSRYMERNEAAARQDCRLMAERVIAFLKDSASGMAIRVGKRAARNRALKLMDEVGISEPRKRFHQYPFEFSGGMRQRIVIAIALAANPDILICDEPTTALDVTIQAQILELINKLKKERGLSIIFITHDLGVVANMADRIAVMYAGKIVEYGASEEIFYEPAHPYTWALLSSMPDLDTKEKLVAIPGTPPNMVYPPEGDAFAERNRYALKIDFTREPPPFRITDTHWAATWLLHPDAPKVSPPKVMTERIEKMKKKMKNSMKDKTEARLTAETPDTSAAGAVGIGVSPDD